MDMASIYSQAPLRPHALVVPALPHSHSLSAMRVARQLLAVGFDVSFIYFSSRPPPKLDTNTIASCSQDAAYMPLAIDAGIHTFILADGIPPQHLAKPFFSTPAMSDNLLHLILHLREQGRPPTCVVAHSFVPWTALVAQQLGIPRIEFWTSNALSYLLNLNVSALCQANIFPEKGNGPPDWKSESPVMLDCIPCLPPVSAELFPAPIRFDPEPSPFRALFKELCSSAKLSDRILVNTVSELEPDAFRGLQAMGIPVRAMAGPLLDYDIKVPKGPQEQGHNPGITAHEANGNSSSHVLETSKEDTSDSCLLWLDTQAESSVIYVAFGTVAKLSAEDVEELAMGLEASGHPFLWALRDDAHVKPGLRGKGMVTSWAPQVKVLAHKAVGGFVTHCGWNSSIECLWEGVPMLGCPQLGDQRSNMWCMRELWGTGLEMKRTTSGGLQKAYVEAGVKALLEGEEGRTARKRAEEMKQVVRAACREDGESFRNMRQLYDDMKALISISV
ncbi:hypothetical protein GOP47_0003264 [Adiantum capillus-veneris]|uniref:Glycosyltransferase n=1 Tax=Adiantum capillus-veneris TaxID=13818 RepID=A0A9D4VBM6_ADICA|nr:hypothetical protein GOP47_0003264 [Adiantum capillus-veneris]